MHGMCGNARQYIAEPGEWLCVWQLHLAHFGGLFWPTLASRRIL
jgi:hypothetical protein